MCHDRDIPLTEATLKPILKRNLSEDDQLLSRKIVPDEKISIINITRSETQTTDEPTIRQKPLQPNGKIAVT